MRRTFRAFPLALAAVFATGVRDAVADDAFIAGYATAILEREFAGSKAGVRVVDGVVFLQPGGLQGRERDKAVAALSRIAGVREVRIEDVAPQTPPDAKPPDRAGDLWQMFPEEQLFSPLLADPRWAHFSMGYEHFSHSRFPNLRNTGVIGLGGLFNIAGFSPPDAGSFTIGLEPAIFALFNLDALSHDLVNADYRLAVPLEYRAGPFSARASVLHQSSHLGDEFLLDTPTQRINFTYEAADLHLSYRVGNFRLYAGGARLLHREPADLKIWSVQEGIEWVSGAGLFGEAMAPLVAVDVQEHQETLWHGNVSVRAGVELLDPKKSRRRIQFLLEYYHGYNPNGQFYRERVDYFGVGIHAYF